MKDSNQEAILYQNSFRIITFFIRIHLLRHKRHIASAAIVDTSVDRCIKYAIVLKEDPSTQHRIVNKIWQIFFDIDDLNLPFEVRFQFIDKELFSKYNIIEQII